MSFSMLFTHSCCILERTILSPMRMHSLRWVILLAVGVVGSMLCLPGHAQSITPTQAKDYVNQQVEVCGPVDGYYLDARSAKEPTFLDMGAPYPHQPLVVVIWGDDRSHFSYPLASLKGKSICVSGTVTLYRGAPEIIVHDEKQIRIQQP